MPISLGVGISPVLLGQGLFEPNASLALDFTTGRYRNGTGGYSSPDFASLPGLTVSRASVGYAETSDGTLVQFGTNVARITDKGLLVEEARTNLLLRSQEFDNASWVKGGNASVTANATLAPDGTLTADQFDFNADAATADAQQGLGTTIGQTYTLSVYVKSAAATTVFLRFTDNVGADVVSVLAPVTTAWTRISVSGVATTTNSNFRIRVGTGQQNKPIMVWGAQLELGAFPTSYIPTTSASATRAADSIRIAQSFSAPLTLYGESNPRAPAAILGRMGELDDGGNVFNVSIGADAKGAIFATGPAGIALGAVIADGALLKVAGNLSAGAIRGSSNGSAVAGGVGATLVTATTLYIGNNAGLARATNGYVRKLVIYPTALSDAALQALTQ